MKLNPGLLKQNTAQTAYATLAWCAQLLSIPIFFYLYLIGQLNKKHNPYITLVKHPAYRQYLWCLSTLNIEIYLEKDLRACSGHLHSLAVAAMQIP